MHDAECMLDGVEELSMPGAKKSTDTVWVTLRRLWWQNTVSREVITSISAVPQY